MFAFQSIRETGAPVNILVLLKCKGGKPGRIFLMRARKSGQVFSRVNILYDRNFGVFEFCGKILFARPTAPFIWLLEENGASSRPFLNAGRPS